MNSDSPLLFPTSHHLGCVRSILHKSLPNGTFGNALIRMGLGTEYLFGTEQRLQQGLLEKHRSPQTDILCCHIYHPRAPSSCGAQHLARVPISTSKKRRKKKRKREKKMPNASRTRCRDTDKLSLALSRKRLGLVYGTVDTFRLRARHSVVRAGAPPVPSPPHLLWTSDGNCRTRVSSRSLRLLPGVDAIQLINA